MVAVVVEVESEMDACPFCGGRDLHVETDSCPGTSFNVECDNPECDASGPHRMTAEEAVAAWNTRCYR